MDIKTYLIVYLFNNINKYYKKKLSSLLNTLKKTATSKLLRPLDFIMIGFIISSLQPNITL